MGFETFDSTWATIVGIETWYMIKKGQAKWEGLSSFMDVFYFFGSII